ncbi:MAG TPA: SGNH/GDSL hydrolase family protein [Actinopolymorphaceae bacterium]
MRRSADRVVAVVVLALVALFVAPGPAQAAPVYSALGDSYSSGVGTREYYPDSGDCKRSPHAYPVLDAARIGADLRFAACSGARTTDVLNGQLGSLGVDTQYVTISIGGNDAGFASVITQCAKPWPTTCWGRIDEAQAFIRDTLPGRLDQVYSAIRSRAPHARVVVVGYPRLFNGEECNIAARISPGEQAELNETADLLATTIAARANAHGFTFVDVRSAFDGHAVCDDVEWVNGLSDPISESYHPNRAGQANGYTPLVEAALRGA